MRYHQITQEERIAISTLRKEGLSASAIAKRLGRHRSSISREFARNSCLYDGCYRHSKAQERTNGRRVRSRAKRQHTDKQYKRITELLMQHYSPEQISGYLRRNNEFLISHETIYRYIWADLAKGGNLNTYLRQSQKKRRKRYKSYDSRGKLANKLMIDQRPSSVETRRYMGHWEIDTVMGKGDKDCIVTIVERKTGFVLIGKIPNRTTEALNNRLIKLIHKHQHHFKSITADNGTEFHGYAEVEKATGVIFYFAKPYHSWERGTNENTNGLIRQYIPKGTSMASLTQAQCQKIANELNARPRKRHGYKTPEECFYGL